jgi:cold shock CspA family protein
MKTGTIVSWNRERGYGFIETANGRKYFFHITKWQSDDIPTVGTPVSFELGLGRFAGQSQAISVSPSWTDSAAPESNVVRS